MAASVLKALGWCAMLSIKKIVLPVDFPEPSLGVVHQAAVMARHFHSEIVMLQVVDVLAATAGWNEEKLKQSLGPELEGLAIRRILVKGDAARLIVQTAAVEKADLIMMPSHGYTFNQFLLGSVTAKVLHGTACPVWTSAHVGVSQVQEFALRNVLCAVDFSPHCQKAVSWAAQMAAEFGARLTLAHVTASMEHWGPGGIYVDQEWKELLVGGAAQFLAEIQQGMGIKADVFIGSGDVPKVLSRAAKETKADLLVTGCYPYSGHLRTHGYAIICAVPVPVLSL